MAKQGLFCNSLQSFKPKNIMALNELVWKTINSTTPCSPLADLPFLNRGFDYRQKKVQGQPKVV